MAGMFEYWSDESLYYYELFFRVQYPAARSKAVALLCGGRPGWESFIFAPIFVRSTRNKLKEHGILGSADRDPESGAEITDPQAKALIVNAQNCIRLYGHPFPGNLEAPIVGA